MLRPATDAVTTGRRTTLLASLPHRDWIAGGALAGGAILWISAPTPFALAGLAVFVLGALLRLDLALVSVVLACPFYLPVEANPLRPRLLGPYAWSLAEVAIGVCALAWSVHLAADPAGAIRRIRRAGWALAPGALFVLAAAASTVFAINRHEALREFRVTIVEPVLFGMMIMTTLDRRGVLRLVWAGVLLGALVALYSFYHYLAIGIVEATGGVRRVLAVYHSPNQLALLLDRLLPMAAAFALPALGEPLRRWLGRGLPALVAALLMAGALALTYSRGALLAVGVALVGLVAVRGLRFAAPAIAAMVLAGAALVTKISPDRLFSGQTSQQRPTLWGAAWRMIVDHPIFGVGPDNFLYAYRDRGYLPPDGWREPDISHPHNLAFDAWLRTGIVGLVALLAAVVLFWRNAIEVLRFRRHPAWLSALALSGGMVAALVHGVIDNGYFLPDLAILFWMAVGGMTVLARETQGDRCGS
ncbi:MAG: O-antigen ligase family protein [Dehalococcoidia bacterium]